MAALLASYGIFALTALIAFVYPALLLAQDIQMLHIDTGFM
jgi:hypothetical protein